RTSFRLPRDHASPFHHCSYGHLFPESSLAKEMFAAVAAAVGELGQHAVSKMSTSRGGVGKVIKARGAVHRELEVVRRTARQIADARARRPVRGAGGAE